MNDVRLRFGLRNLIWLFPNAGVFVIKTNESRYASLRDLVFKVKDVLQLMGRGDIADKIVCERS